MKSSDQCFSVQSTNNEEYDFHRAFAGGIKRPFGVRYNPYTQSVEVLSSAEKIAALVSELRGDLCIVNCALKLIQEQVISTATAKKIKFLLLEVIFTATAKKKSIFSFTGPHRGRGGYYQHAAHWAHYSTQHRARHSTPSVLDPIL